jgi:chromosome segregation ATPase
MSQVKTVKIKDGDDFRVINESDFKYGQHELYEGEKLSTDSVVVNLEVGITPELQATIDEAKAQCEKVVAENAELKTKFQDVEVERDALSTKVKELDLQSVELAEQLNKEREAVKKLTSDNEALNAQLKNLEAKAKKLTAAEAKTAKAAEEAAKVDEPKE